MLLTETRSTWRPPWMRFARFIGEQDSNGCLPWIGRVNSAGYGRFDLVTLTRPDRRVRVLAHRYAYEISVGEIPDGLVLDHLCRNPRCVNPEHLQPVTMAENTKRGRLPEITRARHAAIKACPHGHAYTPENVRHKRTVDGYVQRCCRECERQSARRRMAAKRSAI